MVDLDTPLDRVVGDKTAKVLAGALQLHTVRELLTHYPRRYDRHGELTSLRGVADGEHVTVSARVVSANARPMRQRRGSILDVVVSDGEGRLLLTFFNQAWRQKELQPGRHGLFSGKVSSFRGTRQLAHPAYELLDPDDDATREGFLGQLIPIYPASAQIASWTIARTVRLVLDVLDDLPDPLPVEIRATRGLMSLREAYDGIHRPRDVAQRDAAEARLRFDEAFFLQLALARRRADVARWLALPREPVPGRLRDAFDARLPFELTAGQQEVAAVLDVELARRHPMHRLLQGEVGSGKTVVALRAMLACVDAGGQAALLAPTEVLATQHYLSIMRLLGPLARAGQLDGAEHATRVVLLTGSMSAGARREALLHAASGEAGIVVGTHALLEERVQFSDLGLVVVDEQHRFGVHQRDALRAKSRNGHPHLLVMTATPIPRTVAMTVFGDLDVSELRELPVGRSPIATHLVPQANARYVQRMWDKVREEVAAGHQAYVVCPRIGGDEPDEPDELESYDEQGPGERGYDERGYDERGYDERGYDERGYDERGYDERGPDDEHASYDGGGATDTRREGGAAADRRDRAAAGARQAARPPAAAVLDVLPALADGELAGLRVAALHGRLPSEEKDAVMAAFARGDLDVLVATTVIEVGVDVPNATVMAVLDADRFGMSQLHQLRGRVGRGSAAGWCLLHSQAAPGTPAFERLRSVAETTDGFSLAQLDLQQRREGDVLGAAQSGRGSLKLLSLLHHQEVIVDAREAATALVDADPELAGFPALVDALAGTLDDERADYLERA